MEIQLYTLSFSTAIAYFLQSFVLIILSRINQNYKGIKFWAAGGFAIAIGSLFKFYEQTPSFEVIKVLGFNLFYFLGLILFYIGVLRFMNKKVNLFPTLLFLLFYMLLIVYFLIFNNDLLIRRTISSLFYASITGIVGWSLGSNSINSIKKTAKIVMYILYVISALYLIRALITIFFYPGPSKINEIMQSITFLLILISGLLWTFALIAIITQRMFADMTEAKSQFEIIFKTIPDPVIITDFKRDSIVHFNKGFLNFSGYSVSEINEKSFTELLRWEDTSELESLKLDLISEKYGLSYELSCISKENKILTFIYSTDIITFNNKPHLLNIFRDITKRKYLENQLQIKNEELAYANETKDKFFSIISHDLRGPLSSYVGLTEVIIDQLHQMDPAELMKIMKSIHESSVNLNTLTENLLEWSKIQRGLIRFSPINLNARQEIDKTVSNLATVAKNKLITFDIEVNADITIYADPQMLQTILRNLISNAIKFSNREGRILLAASRENSDNILFSITDNGIGMDEKLVENLLSLNSNIGRPGTEGELSSGLGLVLCKELIERHGTQIKVKSAPLKGSTFYFSMQTQAAH